MIKNAHHNIYGLSRKTWEIKVHMKETKEIKMDIKAIIIILGTILALYVYKRQWVKQKALLKQAYDARLQEGGVDKGITILRIYILMIQLRLSQMN